MFRNHGLPTLYRSTDLSLLRSVLQKAIRRGNTDRAFEALCHVLACAYQHDAEHRGDGVEARAKAAKAAKAALTNIVNRLAVMLAEDCGGDPTAMGEIAPRLVAKGGMRDRLHTFVESDEVPTRDTMIHIMETMYRIVDRMCTCCRGRYVSDMKSAFTLAPRYAGSDHPHYGTMMSHMWSVCMGVDSWAQPVAAESKEKALSVFVFALREYSRNDDTTIKAAVPVMRALSSLQQTLASGKKTLKYSKADSKKLFCLLSRMFPAARTDEKMKEVVEAARLLTETMKHKENPIYFQFALQALMGLLPQHPDKEETGPATPLSRDAIWERCVAHFVTPVSSMPVEEWDRDVHTGKRGSTVADFATLGTVVPDEPVLTGDHVALRRMYSLVKLYLSYPGLLSSREDVAHICLTVLRPDGSIEPRAAASLAVTRKKRTGRSGPTTESKTGEAVGRKKRRTVRSVDPLVAPTTKSGLNKLGVPLFNLADLIDKPAPALQDVVGADTRALLGAGKTCDTLAPAAIHTLPALLDDWINNMFAAKHTASSLDQGLVPMFRASLNVVTLHRRTGEARAETDLLISPGAMSGFAVKAFRGSLRHVAGMILRRVRFHKALFAGDTIMKYRVMCLPKEERDDTLYVFTKVHALPAHIRWCKADQWRADPFMWSVEWSGADPVTSLSAALNEGRTSFEDEALFRRFTRNLIVRYLGAMGDTGAWNTIWSEDHGAFGIDFEDIRNMKSGCMLHSLFMGRVAPGYRSALPAQEMWVRTWLQTLEPRLEEAGEMIKDVLGVSERYKALCAMVLDCEKGPVSCRVK